ARPAGIRVVASHAALDEDVDPLVLEPGSGELRDRSIAGGPDLDQVIAHAGHAPTPHAERALPSSSTEARGAHLSLQRWLRALLSCSSASTTPVAPRWLRGCCGNTRTAASEGVRPAPRPRSRSTPPSSL